MTVSQEQRFGESVKYADEPQSGLHPHKYTHKHILVLLSL